MIYKNAFTLCAAALAFGLTANAQQRLTSTQISSMLKSKTYTESSIHDPSIVYNPANKRYYIVGSHAAIGMSADLQHIQIQDNSSLYSKGYSSEFKSCPTHEVLVARNGATTTETLNSYDAAAFCSIYATNGEQDWISGNQWAPDAIYNPNMGKWCMYLSLNGDHWASCIVMLTADSPKGPFKYEAPIVFGGFNGQTYSGKKVSYKDTDLELVLGSLSALPSRYNTASWGNLWPNCIDPCVFFDDSGELWLAYGSWSGGIFMLKLDKNTGLRDYTTTYASTKSGNIYTSDPYFGKLIAGGSYVSGEGPYIQKIGDYYYLFMSYGFYDPSGGYEMRVFRSANPDGPYRDAAGNTTLYPTYLLNYGPNASTNRGMKLLGAMNNWGTMTTGECAQGHNSAIVDTEGDAFVVYHTKFNDGTYGHLVRVRQLFQNEKDWLVASPFRYTGKQTTQAIIDTQQLFAPEEIAGEYQLLLHPYKLNHSEMQESTPVKVTLTADGKITGARTGTWKYSSEGKSYVTLVIGGVAYYGVALTQNVDGYTDMPAICFSAVSTGGVPVWLYKYADNAAVASGYNEVKNFFTAQTISTNAPQPVGTTTTYVTTNYSTKEPDDALSSDGIFTPTTDGHKVNVTATIESGNYYTTYIATGKTTLKASDIVPEAGVTTLYPESSLKNTTASWWTNFSDYYELPLGGKLEFKFYNYSDAANNWHNWVLYGSLSKRGASDYTEYFGIRCDNWDNTSQSNAGCTSNFVWDTFTNDMNGSLVEMKVEYAVDGTFTMQSTITTTTGKTYDYSYTKTISAKPSALQLFFVNEKSYIDGSVFTGVEALDAEAEAPAAATYYNTLGQKCTRNHRGIIIKNRKAFLR